MIQDWFGYTAPRSQETAWSRRVLGTAIFFYGGSVFLTGAWSELRRRAGG